MFKRMASVPDFWIDVLIALPAGEQPPPLPMLVAYRPAKELDELVRRGLHEFARAVVRDWRDHEDAFSAEAFDNLLDQYPAAARAIWDAYTKAIGEARRKN